MSRSKDVTCGYRTDRGRLTGGMKKMIDISEAKSIIKSVKKALEELQTSGWTVEINNESRSIYLSSGEITIKARPAEPIVLEAGKEYKGYC